LAVPRRTPIVRNDRRWQFCGKLVASDPGLYDNRNVTVETKTVKQ